MKIKKMKKERSVDVISNETKKQRFSIEKIENEILRYTENIAKFTKQKDFYQNLKNKFYE